MRLYGFRDVWIKSTKAFDLKPREGSWFRGELAKKHGKTDEGCRNKLVCLWRLIRAT